MKVSNQLQLPILPGMREDIDRHAGAEPGTLLYAQNVRFRQKGKAQRRPGTTEIDTATVGGSFALLGNQTSTDFVAGDTEKVVGAGGYVWRRDDTAGLWRVAGIGCSAMPVRRLLTMYHRPGTATHPALAGSATVAIDSAGYMVTAYCVNDTSSGQVCLANYYAPDGTQIRADEIGTTVRCRAVAVGATIYLVVQDSAAAPAVVEAYTYTAGARTGPNTLVTLDAQADSWDLSPWPNATAGRWLLTWYDSSSNTVTVRRLNALATEADATFTPAGAPRLSCHANTNHAWVGTVDDTSQAAIARCFLFNAGTLTLAAGPTNMWTFTAADEDSSPPIFGNGFGVTRANCVGWILTTSAVNASSGTYRCRIGAYDTAGSASSSNLYGGYPTSPPFGTFGEYFWADVLTNLHTSAVAGSTSPAPRRPVLLRGYQPGSLISFPELTSRRSAKYINDTARVDRWTRPAQRPNGNWVMPVAVWIPDDSTGAIFYEFLEFEAPCATTRMFASAAGAIATAGQPLDVLPLGSLFSGTPEIGVITAPTITFIDGGGGLGTLPDGTYFFAACTRWVDDIGRVRRSAPSPVATVTISGGGGLGAVTLIVSQQSWFRARFGTQNGQIELYASATDESALYLVDDGQAANPSTLGAVQYTNLTFDVTTITANPELYTDGGVQQNDMPPSCRSVVAAEETLWVGVGFDRTLWQESKPIFPEEPANFSDNDAYKVRFPEDTVAGAYMDGTLIVGSERAIYAVRGPGPDDKGSGSPRAPYQIVSGLGMVNERAVQVTPIGLFFESHRGIELLPRGLGPPQFIGEAVQDQLALRPTILDATFHVGSDASSVRFLISGSPTQDATIALIGTPHSNGLTDTTLTTSGSHTLAAGTNRIVLIGVAFEVGQPPAANVTGATVTYGGLPCTLLASDMVSSTHGVMLFAHLESGLVTGANTVAVQLTQSAAVDVGGMRIGCVAYSGVRQTLSLRTATASGTSAAASNFLLPSDPGAVFVDVVSGTDNTAAGTVVGADQTQRVAGATGGCSCYMSDEAVDQGAPREMSWALNASQDWHSIVAELLPAQVATTSTRELVYDIDSQAWSVDTKPINVGALGSTPDGLLFAGSALSASPALLLEDDTAVTDDGVFFAGRLVFHSCYPAGFTGQTKFLSCVARVTLAANPTGVNITTTLDDDTTRVKPATWTGTDTANTKLYECRPGNFDNRCGAVTVDLFDSTAGGVTWYGATIYHEPEPEMTRPNAPTETG